MEKQPFNTPVQWYIDISIFRNPLLWFQMIMVIVVSSSLILLLLLGLNLFENDWDSIPDSFVIALSVAAGMFILLSLVLLLMFWRGAPTKYILQEDHIEQHTLSKSAKITNRIAPLAIFSGLNAGVTTAGGSLLVKSREIIAVEWKEVTNIAVFPVRKEIRLKNNWRTNIQVFCSGDQFEYILQLIKTKIENYALISCNKLRHCLAYSACNSIAGIPV